MQPTLRAALRCLTAVALAVSFTSCTAKNVVHRVNGSFGKRETGVVFALPRTVVAFEIPVEKVKHEDGRFCADAVALGYAKSDACKGASQRLEAGKTTMKTRGEPDPDQVFLLDLNSRIFEDRDVTMKLTQSGILESGDAKSTNRSVDVAVKTVETLASIAASAAALGGRPAVERMAVSPGARACDAEIKRLQRERDSLFTRASAADKPAASLELVAKKMDERIDAKKAECFVGSDKKEPFWTAQLEVVPTRAMLVPPGMRLLTIQRVADAGHPLAICELPDGVRLATTLEPDKQTEDCQVNSSNVFNVFVWMEEYGQGGGRLASYPSLARSVRSAWDGAKYPVGPGDELAPKDSELGFRFRIPGDARVVVAGAIGGQTLRQSAMADVQVAQLGPMIALPASTGSQSTRYDLTPYTDTGGLKQLKLVTTGYAADDAILEGLSTAAEKAVAAQQSAEAAEFRDIEARRKRLEECEKLRGFEKNLGLTPTDCAK